jgi:MFS family permease
LVASLSPLGVAVANNYIEPKDRVPASAGRLLAYSVGAAIGPVSSAALMRLMGPQGLFVFAGVNAGMLFAFALYRTRRRYWAPVVEKEALVSLPVSDISTPVATELDPRCEPSPPKQGDQTPSTAGGVSQFGR